MRKTYQVLSGFRVGATQRWLMPDDKVQLLPCEAQYPLSRGWLVADKKDEVTTEASTLSVKKKTDSNLENN